MNSLKKLLGVLLAVVLVTGCGCSKKSTTNPKENDVKEDEPKVVAEVKESTNDEALKDQVLGVLTFTDTKLYYTEGFSYLQALVTNTSNEEVTLNDLRIHVWGEDGTELVELTGSLGSSIEAGGQRILSTSYGSDIATRAVNITYEFGY